MRILVGMSGGIDSSVVAYLLKQQGHEVEGVTMTIWNGRKALPSSKHANSCYASDKTEDIRSTRAICDSLGIRHHVLDLSDLYERIVMQNFRDEYLNGRTPNPCIWCNAKIKFGAMVEYAREKGLQFDKFATGHYARIVERNGRHAVCRAVDVKKDQSYFLYRLDQRQLASVLFPLGSLHKEEVREIDVRLGFHTPQQAESQDFYSGDYADLLDVADEAGAIVDTAGQVLGHHEGIWHYTIGQRKGLGISAERPLYVLALKPKTNEVVVGFEEETRQSTVVASQVVWGLSTAWEGELAVQAKIRSTGSPAEAIASVDSDGLLHATFADPVKAATAGQSLVLYRDDTILCGGIIDRAL